VIGKKGGVSRRTKKDLIEGPRESQGEILSRPQALALLPCQDCVSAL